MTSPIEDNIFREYLKKNDKYYATCNFYISEEIDGKLCFNNFDIKKFTPYNENVYILTQPNNNNIFLDRYIDLIIISNISFSLDDININKSDIIKKFMENNKIIDNKLFEDLYFNEDFSKKINLELPKKYNNKNIFLEDVNVIKKYLFKINLSQLSRNFNQETFLQ